MLRTWYSLLGVTAVTTAALLMEAGTSFAEGHDGGHEGGHGGGHEGGHSGGHEGGGSFKYGGGGFSHGSGLNPAFRGSYGGNWNRAFDGNRSFDGRRNDYGRDYGSGYGRDYNRGYDYGRGYGRGYDYGRDYNRGYDYGRGYGGDYDFGLGFGRVYGRGYGRDYDRGYGGDYGRNYDHFRDNYFGSPFLGYGLGYSSGDSGYGYLPDWSDYSQNYSPVNPAITAYQSNYYVPPVQPGQTTESPSAGNPKSIPDNVVLIGVRVPPGGEVWVQGQKSNESSAYREFVSPPLTPGKDFIYDVHARWTDSQGRVMDQTRNLRVRAGERVMANFLSAAPAGTSSNR